MNKNEEYRKLIQKRKNFPFHEIELKNYSGFGADDNYVDGWEQWHNNLDAEIMLVGQDFADWNTLQKDGGKIEPEEKKFKYPTNRNLVTLFNSLGIQIGHPSSPNKNASLFFTNAVVGLKGNGMQGKIDNRWIETGVREFLKPLIEIVQPKIIIALGQIPFASVIQIFQEKITSIPKKSSTHRKNVEDSPFRTQDGLAIFAVYHCGGQSARNRKIQEQTSDWGKIGEEIKKIKTIAQE